MKFVFAACDEWGPTADTDLTLPSLFNNFKETKQPKDNELALGYTLRLPKVKPTPKEPDGEKKPPEYFGRIGLPFSSHILLREDWPTSEGERVETLVHYLAWYLGAVTSPDENSSMRANLGDGRAAALKHAIRLDPLNLLAVNIWVEEWHAGYGRTWKGLRVNARKRLLVIYKTLARLQPDEIPISDYVTELENVLEVKPVPVQPDPKPMVQPVEVRVPEPRPIEDKPAGREQATRAVLQAIVTRATELHQGDKSTKDDALMADYIQTAAKAAMKLDEKQRVPAFALALGLALDDSTVLRGNPLMKQFCLAVENDDERATRLKVIGVPTLRNRRDLCQHYAVSAALTAYVGANAAELVGLAKELADMKGNSGFSFADLAADHAGIELVKLLEKSPEKLEKLAERFNTDDYMIPVKGLREGLSEKRFEQDYGSTQDERFRMEVKKIRAKLAELPGLK